MEGSGGGDLGGKVFPLEIHINPMTHPESTSDPAQVQLLASMLDCMTEHDLCALFAITSGTAEAWRKRRKGPAYSLVGNRVLYPRQAVRDFVERQIRGREAIAAASLL